MVLRITRAAHAQLLAEAAASPDVEVCGLMLGTGESVSEVRACANVSPTPHIAFELDPSMLIAAHKAERAGGPQILGCFHSHPNGLAEPSATDRAQAEDNGWVWAIIAGGEASFWKSGNFMRQRVEII